MLDFTCPSCKTSWQAANDFAGKSILCPKCGQSAADPAQHGITATPTDTPPPLTSVTTPDVAGAAQRLKSLLNDGELRPGSVMKDGGAAAAWVRVGVFTVLVLGAFVILALLIPFVVKVREAAARTQSINNLKQIGLACAEFHDVNKRLPFNGTGPAVANNPTSGSWAFQILPFIDQGTIFAAPQGNRNVPIPVFMCPGRGRPALEISNGGGPWTDYFFNNYLNDPNQAENPKAPDLRRAYSSIEHGTSNTVLIGHGNIRTSQYASNANVILSVNIFVGGTAGTMRSGSNCGIMPEPPCDDCIPTAGIPVGMTLKRDSDEIPTIGGWGGPFAQGGSDVHGRRKRALVPIQRHRTQTWRVPIAVPK